MQLKNFLTVFLVNSLLLLLISSCSKKTNIDGNWVIDANATISDAKVQFNSNFDGKESKDLVTETTENVLINVFESTKFQMKISGKNIELSMYGIDTKCMLEEINKPEGVKCKTLDGQTASMSLYDYQDSKLKVILVGDKPITFIIKKLN